MNKTAIKNFAIWARNKLIAGVSYNAGLIGITESGIAEPLPQSIGDTQFFDIGAAEPYVISGKAVHQREKLIAAIKRRAASDDYKTAYRCIIEEIAYTWFNRLIAIRFMEINDYLPSHVRVLSSESGKIEPDIVSTPFDAFDEDAFSDTEKKHIIKLSQDNKLDELFCLLFFKQCNALNEMLPALFTNTEDYAELLLNLSIIDRDGVLWHLIHDIPEDDFNIERGGQVEIIGWLYQYYNTEPKAAAFAKKDKITKEEIPAVTQLFTPDWIVRYMVENSLGRLWLEGHSDCTLKENWKYYLDEANQEPQVQAELAKIHQEYAKLKPEDIKLIDPCMGSGHILVYAFDVLMQIYESAGYSQRDAAKSILEHNLYGLDIDDRACQLAYFAVMMKARQYNRRILKDHPTCHLYAIKESNNIDRTRFDDLGAGMNDDEKKKAKIQLDHLLDIFTDAKEYGSIINVENYDWQLLRKFVGSNQWSNDSGQIALDYESDEELKELIEIGEIMARKYWVVVTNPPYAGMSKMNARLNKFVQSNYPDYKSDMFSVFVIKSSKMTLQDGFCAFLTPYVWMFIQSYEKMRQYLYANTNIETLIQFEYSAFEEATVPICTFAFRNKSIDKKGTYLRLVDFRGGMEVQRKKTLEAIRNHDCTFYYEQNMNKFFKIPGSPIAYWLGDDIYKFYASGEMLSSKITSQVGTTLGDNAQFMRLWYEVSNGYNKKWFLSHKGGSFRKWYGNVLHIINWENNGEAVKKTGRATVRSEATAFNEGISWTQLTAGKPSFRIKDKGTFIESASCMCSISERYKNYLLAYLNSKVADIILNAMNPTMHFQPGDIKRLPWKFKEINKFDIDKVVTENICISRIDWDSFETSWDFKRHPLATNHNQLSTDFCPLATAYTSWEKECNNRFNKLKANEEELNRIFIDIYGLQDELTPEVEDKDVTVRKADLQRDIKSLISYAVGCIFGRYSLDEDGLIYAGGEWNSGRYQKFIPDPDNIIPISDEDYLKDDDIVTRLCVWLKAVYGEATLEENLDFIAKALGNKRSTSREVIRNYFLKDFFADHCKIYQKRPIYWLFDSGKQNGFKALIYLHRYNADTIGNLRVDYLHRMQRVYESEIDRMQDTIDHSDNAREKAQAAKRKDKLTKQLKECRDYDEKISHLALSRIELDLDDGVKVNYRKMQTARDGEFYEVLANSKNIMSKEKK